MQTFLRLLLILSSTYAVAQPPSARPVQSLNDYVAFLNQAADAVNNRFQRVQPYAVAARQYRQKPAGLLTLASSGPLETYYYKKALGSIGLTPTDRQTATAIANSLWQCLNRIDQTGKALETYVRLGTYQRDGLLRSDTLMNQLERLFGEFSLEKKTGYAQLQRVYSGYQPLRPTNAYVSTERNMQRALLAQQHLFDTLSFYLQDDGPSAWPAARISQSILADDECLATLAKPISTIPYPASDGVIRFQAALRAMQALKRQAIDDYTYAARQSNRHTNLVYVSLLNQYNQDLVASHDAFVDYSALQTPLLHALKLSLVFTTDVPPPVVQQATQTPPFRDVPPTAFTTKPAAPAPKATFLALNGYIVFINESLRQMRVLQLLLRDYQASAADRRSPVQAARRSPLTYAHEAYRVPVSTFQFLLTSKQHIPQPYQSSIVSQAEVLFAMLREMDGLSIELIRYTNEQHYLQDDWQRSDAILDRYALLFDLFDQKKEHLYRDVRRIYDSYAPANPASSWYLAGRALLKTIDETTGLLFGIKAYLTGEARHLPPTDGLVAAAQTLITDEYQNLKGLQRYGRNNGLCPYSPYEDIGENSLRFATRSQAVSLPTATANPYESIYYAYNNELIYQYNAFSELAKVNVLKTINQPDVFAFRRQSYSRAATPVAQQREQAGQPPLPNPKATTPPPVATGEPVSRNAGKQLQHDTIYVNRTRVDTVYVDRAARQSDPNSLAGFAANNLVLLLDVSSSMNSPYKMPLLKQSIHALLRYLRPEDQVSIVVYSGKARVALKPTSGANTDKISRVIDELASDGDTDGNAGIQLAYKVASKQFSQTGNNRIVLATDGEFPISEAVQALIGEHTQQGVYLTVFTFGRTEISGRNLRALALLGQGNYVHITAENAGQQLIVEAQAKKR